MLKNILLVIIVALFASCSVQPVPPVQDPVLKVQAGLVINWNEGIVTDQRGGEERLFALSESFWTYSESNATSAEALLEQGVTIKTPLPGWEKSTIKTSTWKGVLMDEVTINGNNYSVGRIFPSDQLGAGVVQWAIFKK